MVPVDVFSLYYWYLTVGSLCLPLIGNGVGMSCSCFKFCCPVSLWYCELRCLLQYMELMAPQPTQFSQMKILAFFFCISPTPPISKCKSSNIIGKSRPGWRTLGSHPFWTETMGWIVQRSMKNSSRLLLSCPQPRYPGRRHTGLSPKQHLHASMLATCFVQQDDSQVLRGCCETGSQHRQCLSLWQASCLRLFGVLEYRTGWAYTWVNLLSGEVNFSKSLFFALESLLRVIILAGIQKVISCMFLEARLLPSFRFPFYCVCVCVFVFVSLCVFPSSHENLHLNKV